MSLIKSISGIRGTIGGEAGMNLTPIDVVQFTSAFATFIKNANPEKSDITLIIGRDARISGEIINKIVCSTLQSMGINVIDLGLSTTPTVEMAVIHQKADGGIILTASHNPGEWNALKLLNEKGEFISEKDAILLLELVQNNDYKYAGIKQLGSYSQYDQAIEDHIEEILKLDLVNVNAIRNANYSVILDCVNSTGGIALPKLLNKLGVSKVKLINGEPTGIFAHNPEPLPDHLHEISAEVNKGNYDVGFVVDPDVDRLAIVMENGDMFGEEYTLVSIADYILQHKKGNTVSNLSSTRALNDVSKKYGVDCYKSAVGEVNVVAKMKEVDAVIGGEGNGGVIFPELHYGRDSLVGIALFLSYMATSGKDVTEIRSLYPSYFIAKKKIESADININDILNHVAEHYSQYPIDRTDGVKIDFEESWVHLRPSNTEPIIRIYAEAMLESSAENIANKIILDIREFLHQ